MLENVVPFSHKNWYMCRCLAHEGNDLIAERHHMMMTTDVISVIEGAHMMIIMKQGHVRPEAEGINNMSVIYIVHIIIVSQSRAPFY